MLSKSASSDISKQSQYETNTVLVIVRHAISSGANKFPWNLLPEKSSVNQQTRDIRQ